MAAMANQLEDLSEDIRGLLDDLEPVQHSIGMMGKEVAADAASKDLGGDRAFSGMRRKVALSSGYDVGNPVVLHLRPAGLWSLAEDGRRRPKASWPRRSRRRRGGPSRSWPAVRTPYGIKMKAKGSTSKGLGTITKVEETSAERLELAALEGLDETLRGF